MYLITSKGLINFSASASGISEPGMEKKIVFRVDMAKNACWGVWDSMGGGD